MIFSIFSYSQMTSAMTPNSDNPFPGILPVGHRVNSQFLDSSFTEVFWLPLLPHSTHPKSLSFQQCFKPRFLASELQPLATLHLSERDAPGYRLFLVWMVSSLSHAVQPLLGPQHHSHILPCSMSRPCISLSIVSLSLLLPLSHSSHW